MTTKPFDRMALNLGERPVSIDVNQLQSDLQRSQMWFAQSLLEALGTTLVSGAATFFDDGFLVTQAAVPAMSVLVTAGLGVLYNPSDEPTSITPGIGPGTQGIDDVSPLHPLPLAADQALTVPANSSGSTRTDIIEVITDRRFEGADSRDILNTGTGAFVPTSVDKVLAYYLDGRIGTVAYNANSTTGIGYKTGNPGAGAPTVTSGYTKIATITVATGAVSILDANIADNRNPSVPGISPAQQEGLAPSSVMGGLIGAGVTGVAADAVMVMQSSTNYVVMPHAGKLSNLRARIGATGGAVSGHWIVTVYKNGVATALVAEGSASSTGTYTDDTTHTVTFAAGDLIAFMYHNSIAVVGGAYTGLTAACEVTLA